MEMILTSKEKTIILISQAIPTIILECKIERFQNTSCGGIHLKECLKEIQVGIFPGTN
jgi:hypothetical protein